MPRCGLKLTSNGEVDIDADPELRAKYNDEVPVVFIDGRKAFKYRMSGTEFLRALAGR